MTSQLPGTQALWLRRRDPVNPLEDPERYGLQISAWLLPSIAACLSAGAAICDDVHGAAKHLPQNHKSGVGGRAAIACWPPCLSLAWLTRSWCWHREKWLWATETEKHREAVRPWRARHMFGPFPTTLGAPWVPGNLCVKEEKRWLANVAFSPKRPRPNQVSCLDVQIARDSHPTR